jgi:hypothetical protein
MRIQIKIKGGGKSDDNDSSDNEAIAALFGKDEPIKTKGISKKAEEMTVVQDMKVQGVATTRR